MVERKKVCIRLKAFEHRILDDSSRKIAKTAQRTGAEVRGPFPLPSKTRRNTLLRGPHIDKKSREQIRQTTHLRVIEIVNLAPETLNALKQLELPGGVGIKVVL